MKPVSPQPRPLKKVFFTPGTLVLTALMATGFAFGVGRLLSGLEVVTNLDNNYPWGIWTAINVAGGVALAAGGFTTAALVDIFGGQKYRPFLRPALLTAWLGYIMVAVGLLLKLGRYWNIWRPVFHWQGNSVMFELSMCVMTYLIVLTFEMAPSILEGLSDRSDETGWWGKLLKTIEKPVKILHSWIKTVLPILVVAGVVLSCMHQSSLGTLMVIVPTKLSPLWYTTWLPVLFLLSAVMVGFPMVIMETIASTRGMGREARMELVAPLAAKIPWFLAVYGLFRFGDLIARGGRLDFLESPGSTVSFAIEICMGLLVPLVMLCFRQVRQSRGWLFVACFLVVFGVALNRINVFLVGYHPSFPDYSYFPSIGETVLTVCTISLLIFLYRFFVNYFPIMTVPGPGSGGLPGKGRERIPQRVTDRIPVRVSPRLAWGLRGAAVLFLFAFGVLYAVVHQRAIETAGAVYGDVAGPATADTEGAANASFAHTHQFRPEKYRSFYLLSSPLLNTGSNDYEPVLFSHRTHDDGTGGNCYVCHHRYSEDSSDRVGVDLADLHREMGIRLGGACAACHEGLEEKEFRKCAFCHATSNEPDFPARIGLRGAYHRQCIGCHQEQGDDVFAPTGCKSCHRRLVPDHQQLVPLPGVTEPTPRQLVGRCLDCHPGVDEDIRRSAHWTRKGPGPAIAGSEHRADLDLRRVINNYTITMDPRLMESPLFDINIDGTIDCFICHDTTGTYRKDRHRDGIPAPGVEAGRVARRVGHPTTATCGGCHFYLGGWAGAWNGDLEPGMAEVGRGPDVHTAQVGIGCPDCHRSESHRIPGRSFNSPVSEGGTSCKRCHGGHPHGITGYLSRHLDDHVRAVACETCHIPFFAQESPTRLYTDFSTAGQKRSVQNSDGTPPEYDEKWGTLRWGQKVVPEYRWFDGTRTCYMVGDKIDPGGPVELNAPLGEKYTPRSRIFPFKVHGARQPYDRENRTLAAVKFSGGFWEHGDWNRAIADGMAEVGLPYSGAYDFVETRMYSSIHHGVRPADRALGCADCHSADAVDCRRCHKKAEGMDRPGHTRAVYPEVGGRMDFRALGYEDDPALIGGRFYIKMGRGKPPE